MYDRPPAYTTAQCPPQVGPTASGDFELPDIAQGPDKRAAVCDCKSGRQARAATRLNQPSLGPDCDAIDGGDLGELLQDLLEHAAPNSDHEDSCDKTIGVRVALHFA